MLVLQTAQFFKAMGSAKFKVELPALGREPYDDGTCETFPATAKNMPSKVGKETKNEVRE